MLKRLHALRGGTEEDLRLALENHRAEQTTVAYGPNALLSSDPRHAAANLWSTEGLSEDDYDEFVECPDWSELADTDIPEQSPVDRRQEILDDARWHAGCESEARTRLSDNEQHVGSDTCEWDLRDYDIHFLFACYAVDMTVQPYLEHLSRDPR